MAEETLPIMFTSMSFSGDWPTVGAWLLQPWNALPPAVTIEAWINVRTQRQHAGIVSGAMELGGHSEGFGLQLDGASGIQFFLKPPGQPAQLLSSGANTITPNKWHHAAVTYDGQRMSTYVDGQLATTLDVQTDKLQVSTNPLPLCLAAHADFVNDFDLAPVPVACFDGRLSDVRLWSRCISPELIASGRHQRLRGDEAGLVKYSRLGGEYELTSTTYREWIREPRARSFPPSDLSDWGVPGLWRSGDEFLLVGRAHNHIIANRFGAGAVGAIGYGEVSGEQITMNLVSGRVQTGTIAAGSRQIAWDDGTVWERCRTRA